MSINKEAIARAADGLVLGDVYLRELHVSPKADFHPDDVPSVNFGWGAIDGQVIGLPSSPTTTVDVWRVRFKTECKLLRVAIPADQPAYTPSEDDVGCSISAVFILDYEMKSPLDDADLREFAAHNVSYHVWPYWREQLHDVLVRMRLPIITLPMHRVSHAIATDRRPPPTPTPSVGVH